MPKVPGLRAHTSRLFAKKPQKASPSEATNESKGNASTWRRWCRWIIFGEPRVTSLPIPREEKSVGGLSRSFVRLEILAKPFHEEFQRAEQVTALGRGLRRAFAAKNHLLRHHDRHVAAREREGPLARFCGLRGLALPD